MFLFSLFRPRKEKIPDVTDDVNESANLIVEEITLPVTTTTTSLNFPLQQSLERYAETEKAYLPDVNDDVYSSLT